MITAAHDSVINSYVSGLNCIARTGKCTDATGIGGGGGDEPIPPSRFTTTLSRPPARTLCSAVARHHSSTDIEIRRNHLFRPMLWKEGEPGYTPTASGNPYIVKNNFELKSAIRLLFEANLLENSWGGSARPDFPFCSLPRTSQQVPGLPRQRCHRQI